MKNYYVYILTNYTNNVFYTGVTNNLQRRILEHKTKVSPKSFSAKYKLYKLLWFEEFYSPLEAIAAEKKRTHYLKTYCPNSHFESEAVEDEKSSASVDKEKRRS